MDGTPMQRPDRSAMLAALEHLVVAESPSLDKARCDACADEVARLFQQRVGVSPIRHRRPDAGDHLEVRIGDGAEPIVLLCHHDTVWPEGTVFCARRAAGSRKIAKSDRRSMYPSSGGYPVGTPPLENGWNQTLW